MLKVLLRAALVLLFVCGGAAAQETPENPPAEDAAAREAERKLKQEIDERFLNLEQRLYGQNELGLRRLEHVEERIDSSQRHVDRVLLIFALSLLVIFLFIGTHLKNQQKIASERVKRATQEAENLMADIQRELARPEMEHLRISQILRRMMRRLRDENRQAPSIAYINEIRNAGNDPYLPVSLHFIARVLEAEYDGNWNTAVQMLEQLREMDTQDPDVLLHLSHVHKNVAARAGDRKVRRRHEQLSYQYYGQFTSVMQAEGTPGEDVPPPERIVFKVPDEAPAAPVEKTAAPAEKTAAPAVTEKAAPAAEKTAPLLEKTVAPAAEKITAPPPEKAAPPPPEKTAAPLPEKAAPPPMIEAATPATPAADTSAAVTAPPPPAAPAEKTPAAAVKAQAAEKVKSVPATATSGGDQAVTTKQRLKNIVSQAKNIKSTSVKESLSSIRNLAVKTSSDGVSSALSGLTSLTKIMNDKGDEPLPFLPVPPTSEVPAEGDEHTVSMWREIQRGDLAMARATQAKTLRERNRIIDNALVSYARAQAHKTNKTLYHNWGITLLAKALHMPVKKRAPLYNAAVDKFLAGNVVAPNYFDFHLASLYAIIGDEQECRKWLTVAREHGGLDTGALMQAPDFDSVRHAPWFDEFLQQ